MRNSSTAVGLLFSVLIFSSCSLMSVPSNAEYPSSARRSKLVEAASGERISEEAAFRAMVDVAGAVAIALRDDGLRRGVYEALHASPYVEHKLHFRTFTSGGVGAEILSAAAAAAGRSLDAMRALRDSAIDLEFYMSEKSHFSSWTGDANILVATAYDPDEDIPIAFNLNGERVTLTSARIAPSIPVLGLVRVETDFSRYRELQGLSRPGTPAGIYMVFSYLSDLHEGFLSGSPEIEVFTNWRLAGNDSGQWTQCSGESAGDPNRAGPGIKSSWYAFNQDDNTWTGSVRIMDSAQAVAAEGVDSLVTFWMWEDDNTRCEIHVGAAGDADAIYRQILTPTRGWRNRFSTQAQDPLISFIQKAWSIISGILNGAADDFVGLLIDPAHVSQSWDDANLAVVHHSAGVVGRVRMVRFESQPPSPPPSFQVTINGPTTVGPNNNSCSQWLASVQGGQSPYQYQWYGLSASTDYYAEGTVPQNGAYLEVVVTDSQGNVRNASIGITYDPDNEDYCQ